MGMQLRRRAPSFARATAVAYLAAGGMATYIVLGSRAALSSVSIFDLPLLLLIGAHLFWGALVLVNAIRGGATVWRVRAFLFVPQLLLALSLIYFLFSYVFALNANMDYVQRFMAAGGNLSLALDTRAERLVVVVRLAPLMLVNLLVYVLSRIGHRHLSCLPGRRGAPRRGAPPAHAHTPLVSDRTVVRWALAWVALSAFLRSTAQPSFLSLDGLPLLGWIAYVPLFVVLRRVRLGYGAFLGVLYGSLSTLIANYWLGTFNLVSLQITVFIFSIYYAILAPVALTAYGVARSRRWARVLLFPAIFTLFEYLHSIGFLGYPWSLAAHSQYPLTSLIQISALTGVWGVSFLVYLVNGIIAELIDSPAWRVRSGVPARVLFRRSWRLRWAAGAAGLLTVVVFGGALTIAGGELARPDAQRMSVALIQQNTDPRKNDYDQTLDTLIRLTDEAVRERPQLIVWSETAFVPNIRRWSVDDTNRRFHRLVQEFRAYQAGTRRWLVTGNDDYELDRDEAGEIVDRLEYNATVLFSPLGERMETYRKVRLVPFTEYFPYAETFPGIYELLQEFDVSFWEPGTERTVFEHPQMRFVTPICYEDVFPNHVREFVNAGAQVIINVSNDYWSLAPVQAKQHFVASLFRAVENRRPLLRSTASGLTGHINEYGRILETLPYYESAQTVVEVEYQAEPPTTVYGRHGDWFPIVVAGLLVAIIALGAASSARRRAAG